MKNYNPIYLNELITLHKSKGFYMINNNYVYDIRMINCALSYVDKLLTETEKCNIQNKYKSAVEYYYQMASHCFAAGLIISHYFSKNEFNDLTIKMCLELLTLGDTIVTADRVANINNLEKMEIVQSCLFNFSLESLKAKWNGEFDNNNIDVVTVLLSFVLAASCEDLNRYRFEEDADEEEIYWRDENGKIRCLGDNCIHDKCPDDCPIWKNSIALQLIQNGQYNNAIPFLQDATRLASDFKDVWANLGACYGYNNQYEYAYGAYKTAYEIDNKYNNAIFGLALTSKDLNKKEEALKWCELYDSLFSDNKCKFIKEFFKPKEELETIHLTGGKCLTPVLQSIERQAAEKRANEIIETINSNDKDGCLELIADYCNSHKYTEENILRLYKLITDSLISKNWIDIDLRTLNFIIKLGGNKNYYAKQAIEIRNSKYKKQLFSDTWIKR